MNFGEILSQAWQIIWRHKILWLFGILAGCGTASGGSGVNFTYSFSSNQLPNWFQVNLAQPDSEQMMTLLSILGIAAFVLVLIAIFLGTIGRIAIVKGSYEAEQNATLAFGDLFRSSIPYFWRVFGLVLMVMLVILVSMFALAVLSVIGVAVTLGLLLICLIPLLCLLVPLYWFISIIIEQSTIAIVIDNLGITAGFKRGWDITRRNLGNMLLMGLILYLGLGMIAGILIGIPLFVAFYPVFASMMYNGGASASTGWLITSICLVGAIPMVLVLSGILQSYITSVWTLVYLQLSPQRPQANPISIMEPIPPPG